MGRRGKSSVLIALLIACIYFLMPGHFLRGHHDRFYRITTNQGLLSNSVYAITRDSRGFVWIGTPQGLSRYDGYGFVHFKHKKGDGDSLANNLVREILEDSRGILWVGTGSGLNRFDRRTGRFIHYGNKTLGPGRVKKPDVRQIFEDRDGSIWFGGYDGGLGRIDAAKDLNHVTWFQHNEGDDMGLSSGNVRTVFRDSTGRLWVGTTAGLDWLDETANRFYHYRHQPGNSNSLSNNNVVCIYEDHEKVLWVGTRRGLNRFDRSRQRFRRYFHRPGDGSSLSGDLVVSMFEMPAGDLVIGTMSGLSIYNRRGDRFINYFNRPGDTRSLGGNSILSLFVDAQGILWVGTWGGGISVFDPGKEKFHLLQMNPGKRNSLNSNMIFSVYQEPSGVVWIGTWEGGLNKYNPKTGRFKHYRSIPGNRGGIGNNSVTGIKPDHNRGLWLATWGGGVKHFKPVSGTFTHYRHSPSDSGTISSDLVHSIRVAPNGTLWAGTFGGGVDMFDPSSGNFTRRLKDKTTLKALKEETIQDIFPDSEGTVWFGTERSGVYRLDYKQDKIVNYRHNSNDASSLSSNIINTFFKSTAGTLWIGTDGGGLNRFVPAAGKWRAFTQQEGLPGNDVRSIEQDNQGNLWLGTNKGICKFNPVSGECENYGMKDGLQGDEFNLGASFFNSRTGEMFFGGINGLNNFVPSRIKRNTFVPPVYIATYKRLDRQLEFSTPGVEVNEIRLPEKDNLVAFEFAALNFRNPEANRYAYKLEGLDKDWVYSGTRRYAAYTNLKGGDYVFRVKASNDDGIWNEKGSSVKVVILPPFWKKLWFQATAVSAVLLLIIVLYRWRMRREEVLREKLESLVNERTGELRKRQSELVEAREIAEKERRIAELASRSKSDFLARMSHEIRTPMNAVIGFTEMLLDTRLTNEQNDYADTINRSGQSLLGLLNDILDASKIESGQLHLESIDFDPEVTAFDVCDLMRPRLEDKDVGIFCRIGETVPAFLNGDPGRFRQVLLNLMGNAVKFTEKGRIELTIDVDMDDGDCIVLHSRVKDTGIGIPQEKQQDIFNEFQQADGSHTRKFGGSGLGLAICKELAQLMSGEIRLESELGKGSTFHFTARLKKSDRGPTERAIPASLPGKRILVVDDDPKNLEWMSYILTAAGVHVKTLPRGESVLPAIENAIEKKEPFDLCILDIRMPGLNGYQVAEQLQAPGSPRPTMPLLAFSSSLERRTMEFKKSGFHGFLPRPIQRQRLLEMVEQLLSPGTGTGDGVKESRFVTRHSIAEDAKHSVHILLVEDNLINQKLARFLLTRAGYGLTVANNGKEAVDIFLETPERFDLILMDIQMPEMDGLEATQVIRKEGFQDVPIVALTAQTMKGDREKFLASGMNDFIAKPIKREHVFEMVRKWTCRRRKNACDY